MKYLICEKPGKLEIKQKSIPERKFGEALLKVRKVGICGTDIHAYSGNQAFFIENWCGPFPVFNSVGVKDSLEFLGLV